MLACQNICLEPVEMLTDIQFIKFLNLDFLHSHIMLLNNLSGW
jgi:hypothetical protein